MNLDHKRKKNEESELPRELYFGESYFRWELLASLSRQLMVIRSLGVKKVLEIGKGNGFVSDFLKKSGLEVTTIDVNPGLEPDVVGSVLELDRYFEPGSFDCVLCAEVLEHLPFSDFDRSLEQISNITSGNAVITLPRLQKVVIDFEFRLKIPFFRTIESGIFYAWRSDKANIYDGHHWEINSDKETSVANLEKKMGSYFKIERVFRERWNNHHQFFILQKK